MPYSERMFFLFGVGVVLVGAGWFCLTRFPLEAAPAAEVSADAVGTPADAPTSDPKETVSVPEPNATVPIPEGEAIPADTEAPQVPEIEVPQDSNLENNPTTEYQGEASPSLEEGELESAPEGGVEEYPLPESSVVPTHDGRDEPVQMLLLRDRPIEPGTAAEGEAPLAE